MSNLLDDISAARTVTWHNPSRGDSPDSALPHHFDDKPIGPPAIEQARTRLKRFAPLLAALHPELAATEGCIESDLVPISHMQSALGLSADNGAMWLKADHSLPVAGSVKARGGFHEVLEVAQRLALQHRLIEEDSDYQELVSSKSRNLFSKYQIAVGSTGNLGLSIGVMAAALGFRAVVHMSSDAKEWKKERLRLRGVEVIEHEGDYEQAVSRGRAMAISDPLCHFVDDERSTSLFLGYSAAAHHLQKQLTEKSIRVDAEHPLMVYIPCGVGGAPAGIAWGLHHAFGAHVHCYFAEPVQSPCFLLQMLASDASHPSVYDYGLTNRTEADGLAVPRASVLAAQVMKSIVAGAFTVEDATLFEHLQMLHSTEGFRIEPSAAAGFGGPLRLQGTAPTNANTTHLVWTTGGSLVPDSEYSKFLSR